MTRVMSVEQYEMECFIHDLFVIGMILGIYYGTIVICTIINLPRLIWL